MHLAREKTCRDTWHMDESTPAKRVKALRLHLGLSQDLADRGGPNRTVMNKIENGGNKLSGAKSRAELARAFGVDVDTLNAYLDERIELGDVVRARAGSPPAPGDKEPERAAEQPPPAGVVAEQRAHDVRDVLPLLHEHNGRGAIGGCVARVDAHRAEQVGDARALTRAGRHAHQRGGAAHEVAGRGEGSPYARHEVADARRVEALHPFDVRREAVTHAPLGAVAAVEQGVEALPFDGVAHEVESERHERPRVEGAAPAVLVRALERAPAEHA